MMARRSVADKVTDSASSSGASVHSCNAPRSFPNLTGLLSTPSMPASKHAEVCAASPDAEIAMMGVGGISRPLSIPRHRSEEHTSELQSLMRISYPVFCLKKKTTQKHHTQQD